MEIQEKAWVYEFPGTRVQDDDFICVICLGPMYEVNSSAIADGMQPFALDCIAYIVDAETDLVFACMNDM